MSGISLSVNPGDKYGYLTVLKEIEREYFPSGLSRRMFLVHCQCGKDFKIPLYYLSRGKDSCGCIVRGLTTEERKTRNIAFKRWLSCRSNNYDVGWPKKWETFSGFIEDMGISTLYLKRSDLQLPYSKENCYWSIKKGNERLITYKGQIKNISDWAKELGISRERLRQRLEDRPLEEAMSGVKTWVHPGQNIKKIMISVKKDRRFKKADLAKALNGVCININKKKFRLVLEESD